MRVAGWWLGLCLVAWLLPAAAGTTDEPLSTTRIAPGIFFHAGQQAEENSANHGDIANVGFIIGSRCVAVVDTGGSPWVGRHLLQAIRERTKKPVCYVINTHMHPDHVMGNRPFARHTDARFVAQANLPEALATRTSAYFQTLSEDLKQKPEASWIVMPNIKIKTQRTLDLGNRKIVLRAWPTAHTDNDLTVYDDQTHTLCAGDLLFIHRIPSIDGSLLGWIDDIDTLTKRQDIERVIPGHGALNNNWRMALRQERAYLITLRDGVRKVLANGGTLEDATAQVGQSARNQWLLFDQYNARNVTAAYTELEWE